LGNRGCGLVPQWFLPRRRPALPEPFPTSPSGSPWGGGEVGNGGGRPPEVVFAGRRPTGTRAGVHGASRLVMAWRGRYEKRVKVL
jgi:hypothetical protein